MTKYHEGKLADSEHGHLDAELQHSMKLFRAQRNYYIAGFALFLCLYVLSSIVFIICFIIIAMNLSPVFMHQLIDLNDFDWHLMWTPSALSTSIDKSLTTDCQTNI